MFRPLALALCLPALSLASAQTGLDPFGSRIRAWPSSETGGSFGRFLDGDVSPLPGQEVIGLRGGRLYVIADPTAYDGVERVDSSLQAAADLAVIRGGGPEGHDSLLTVDPVQGLKHHVVDLATGNFTSVVLDSSWTSVTHLAVGDLDGDSVENDIIGGDGMIMLPLVHNGTTYVAGSAHVNTTPITDLEVLDYDANGSPDIAMLTEGGLEVIEYGGPAFPFSAAPLPGGTITALPRANVGGHDLVWVTKIASTWFLFVQDAFGRSAPVALRFPPGPSLPVLDIDYVDVSPAQLSNDNALDLLVSQNSLTEAIVLLNVGTTAAAAFSSTAGDYEMYNIAITSMASNDAVAAAGVGGGGEPFFYYPLDSDDAVYLAQVPPYSDQAALTGQGGLNLEFYRDVGDLTRHVFIEFNNPGFASGPYNGIQLVMFHHCEVGDAVEPIALGNQIFLAPPGQLGESRYRARLTLPLGLCSSGGPGPGPTISQLNFRFVDASISAGVVTIHDAERLDTLAVRYGSQADLDELDTLPTWLQGWKVIDEGSGTGGLTPGEVVLLDEMPIFGGPARPGTPTEGPLLTPVLP